MNTEKVTTENGNLPIYGVISRALVDAVKEESDYDYDQHGESWRWAINEMSDEVNEIWREKMNKIYELACQLDDKLKEHGL
jgi:hypothetical protein